MILLISIVLVALVIGVFFLVTVIALGGFIYNGIKKNTDTQHKCLKVLIPAAIVWFLLIMVNVVLVIVFLYNNGGEMLNSFTQFIQNLK